jgi:putative membrane protein
MKNNHSKQSEEALILLAEKRTDLANERTGLAYLRTGFSSFLLGIGLIELFKEEIIAIYIGWGAILFGVILIFFGLVQYIIRRKKA